MTLKKFFIAALGVTALLACATAFSHHERKQRSHYHYYYWPAEVMVDGTIVVYLVPPPPPPPPPVAYRELPAPPAPQKPQAKAPQGFPKESAAQRAQGKDRRREILEQELAAEMELLVLAEKGSAGKENLELHEKNVAALKRELKNLSR